jgi:hypothetical protein
MMSPLSNRNQQTGQVNLPFALGLVNDVSLPGTGGVSADASDMEVSG